MKKIFLSIFALITVVLMAPSCVKDTGNYDYSWKYKVVVDSLKKQYSITRGERLHIEPTYVVLLNGDTVTTPEFKYMWVAATINQNQEVPKYDTISHDKNLDYVMELPNGNYLLECLVIDESAGLVWRGSTQLSSVLSAAKGWVFLEKDAQGYADISMMALNEFDEEDPKDFTYKKISKMLSNTNIDKELKKNPRQIRHFDNYISPGQGIWFVTDNVTGYLDIAGGHSWAPNQKFSNFVIDQVDPNYTVKRLYQFGLTNIFAITKNDKIRYASNRKLLFSPEPNESFKISPYIAVRASFSAANALCYNADAHRFVLLKSDYTWNMLSTLSDATKGLDLVYMQSVGQPRLEVAYALLKDPVANEMYYMQLDPAEGTVIQPKKLMENAPSIIDADHYIFHQVNNAPYYAKGNNLYVLYNEKEMPVSFTFDGEITALYNRAFENEHIFKELAIFKNYIMVATKSGSGAKVYIFEPKSGHPEDLGEPVHTFDFDNEVVSMDYQTDFNS